jgi:hypothetical protein
MNYVCYELDEDPEAMLNWFERLQYKLYKHIEPKLNPEFHHKYNDVIYWWLELNEQAIAVREIGFDSDGEPLVVGPFGRNRGLFTHSKNLIRGFYPIEMYQFEEQWEKYQHEQI